MMTFNTWRRARSRWKKDLHVVIYDTQQ